MTTTRQTELGAILLACARDLATDDDGVTRGTGLPSLAREIGVAPNTLRDVIEGEREATPGTMALIARYLEQPDEVIRQWASIVVFPTPPKPRNGLVVVES